MSPSQNKPVKPNINIFGGISLCYFLTLNISLFCNYVHATWPRGSRKSTIRAAVRACVRVRVFMKQDTANYKFIKQQHRGTSQSNPVLNSIDTNRKMRIYHETPRCEKDVKERWGGRGPLLQKHGSDFGTISRWKQPFQMFSSSYFSVAWQCSLLLLTT